MDARFLTSELRSFVQQTMELWHVPGLALAVVKDGQVIFCDGFGMRNVAGGLPVTANTLFQIASCTKAFTSMAVGLLVDEGKLAWDKPIRDYLPTFKLYDQFASERMTPRDLLCHRSGLPRHDIMWYGSLFSRREIFDRLRYLEPSADLRTAYQYSNLMFMVAGILVAEVAGMSWERFVQTRIFDRLGMTHSNFSTEVTQRDADFATPYLYKDGQTTEIPFFKSDGENDSIGPAGDINSCASDMGKWLQLHLNHGKLGDEQFISAANLEQMHMPQMPINDMEARTRFGFEFTSYGLGWGMRSYKGEVIVSHGGGMDGFASFTSFMPRHDLGVVALANLDPTMYNMPAPQTVSYTIYDRLLGLPATDWNALLHQQADEQKEADMRKKAMSADERKAGAAPSHPLEDFLGDYEHPGYGIVTISNDGGALRMTTNGRMSLALEHYHYDIFEANLQAFDYRLKLSFGGDLKGNIAQVAIQMEPAVKDIIFTRLPDKRLSEQSFLEQFCGVYDLPALTLTVVLKDARLTATIPGQPEYLLIPYRGTEFAVQGMTGYSLTFKLDESGVVGEALVNQPDGLFVAKKRR